MWSDFALEIILLMEHVIMNAEDPASLDRVFSIGSLTVFTRDLTRKFSKYKNREMKKDVQSYFKIGEKE